MRERTGCGKAGFAGLLAPPPHRVVADVSLNFLRLDSDGSSAKSDTDAVQTVLVEKPINATLFHAKQPGDLFDAQQHPSCLSFFRVPLNLGYLDENPATALADADADVFQLALGDQPVHQRNGDAQAFGNFHNGHQSYFAEVVLLHGRGAEKMFGKLADSRPLVLLACMKTVRMNPVINPNANDGVQKANSWRFTVIRHTIDYRCF